MRTFEAIFIAAAFAVAIVASDDFTTEVAATDIGTEAPIRDSTTEAPIRDSTTEAPVRDVTTEAPVRDPTTGAPVRDVTTEASANDKSNETQTILGCLRGHVRNAIELSRNNTKNFLRKLSPKESFNKTWASLNAAYDALQADVENTTQVVIADRTKCEENNKKTVFPRNCDLLAKLAYMQRNTKLFASFMAMSTKIIVKASFGFHMKNIVFNVMSFAREQNGLLLKTLASAVGCIKKN